MRRSVFVTRISTEEKSYLTRIPENSKMCCESAYAVSNDPKLNANDEWREIRSSQRSIESASCQLLIFMSQWVFLSINLISGKLEISIHVTIKLEIKTIILSYKKLKKKANTNDRAYVLIWKFCFFVCRLFLFWRFFSFFL